MSDFLRKCYYGDVVMRAKKPGCNLELLHVPLMQQFYHTLQASLDSYKLIIYTIAQRVKQWLKTILNETSR